MNILIISLIAGLITGVGSIIGILIKRPSNNLLALSLSFAAGIMIGISLFNLFPQSLKISSLNMTIFGIIIGFLFMKIIDIFLPAPLIKNNYLKMGYFIALGIAIHNLPEGLAIGASNIISTKLGLFTAITIAFHNIAEGIAVALPLSLGNIKKTNIFLITILAGLSTFFGTLFGIFLINISKLFIAISLAFAAGSMLYIAYLNLLPESYRKNKLLTYLGLAIGIIISFLLI